MSSEAQPNNKRSNESSTISIDEKTKGSKLSISDSPSKSACNNNGLNDIRNNKRSVVYHQFALMLIWAVAKIESRDISKEFEDLMIKIFPDCQLSIDTINNMRDENCCFAECYANWPGKEKVLTKSLADMIEETNIVKKSTLEVSNNESVQIGESWGLLDVLIKDGTSPVMVIEVGLNNNDFWKKFDQASKYMQQLIYKSRSPILLTVLTISNKEENPFEARLGMFLFVPRLSSSTEYRVILIWRKKYSEVVQLSKSFSTVLVAASFLSKLRRTETIDNCKTLGPNCCRIGDKVLRAYDDRMLKTQRRPDIYLRGVTDVVEKADVLCDLYDENVTQENHQFGIEHEGNADQMWKFEGRLLVISTTFHNGRHWAQRPTDFVPIIEQLRKLHENGFVHGDIRGSNLVIFNEEFGKLIDFDFGGKIDVNKPEAVTYPVGYSKRPFDGSRMGVPSEPITMDDDWYALIKFIFHFHEFLPPEVTATDSVSRNLALKVYELEHTFGHRSEAASRDPTKLAEKLLRFLKDINAQYWTVMLEKDYESELKRYGLKEGSDPGIDESKSSKLATGSPQRVVKAFGK